MTSVLQQAPIESVNPMMFGVFVAGMMASLGVCAAVRLPIVLAYVAGAADCKKHGIVLSALFAFGLIAGTILLGITACPTDGGVHKVLYANRYLFWLVGMGLFITGVLVSGLINPQLLPARWQRQAQRLTKAGIPGAFLLGCAFGLLQMPACPRCGSALAAIAQVAGRRPGLYGLVLFAGFAAGQGLVLFAVGTLTGLIRPELLLRLRTRMCSLEQRVQLLAGNVLMVLGIYFVIVS